MSECYSVIKLRKKIDRKCAEIHGVCIILCERNFRKIGVAFRLDSHLAINKIYSKQKMNCRKVCVFTRSWKLNLFICESLFTSNHLSWT